MADRMLVDVSVWVAAAPDVVWARLTAHESMAAWWPGLREVTLDPPGTPDRNGLGAVRVMRSVGTPVREEVVSWDPPRTYSYRVRNFAPLRDHLGRVTVRPADGGAAIDWCIEFRPAVPGTGALLRIGLRWMLGVALRRFTQLVETAPAA